MHTFTDYLDKYLELTQMEERDHPLYVDGYTCKQYYKDVEQATNNLNAFFPAGGDEA